LSEDGRERPQTTIETHEPHRLHSAYAKLMFVSLLYKPQQERVLVVGLGGGAMLQFIRHQLPETFVDAVELDPQVVAMADKWFGVRSGPKANIVAADGFAFIEQSTSLWDVIYMDTFLDPGLKDTDSSGVPLHLRKTEFLKKVGARVGDGGIVVFNIHHKSAFRSHLLAIEEAFPHVRVFKPPKSGNRVVIASQHAHPSDEELRNRAQSLDQDEGWGLSFSAMLDGMF
jgi:spermidine synthase